MFFLGGHRLLGALWRGEGALWGGKKSNIFDTHISARGTTCAPSKNMCAPAQAQNVENNIPL